MKTYIAYYRVSTQKQGFSGLGLEGQMEMVKQFVKDGNVVSQYTEVASRKKNERPELLKAIDECLRLDATLLIAKIDRLTSNYTLLETLRDKKVKFIACDNPSANELMIDIYVAISKHEIRQISERTKTALAAKKSRGFKLGGSTPEHCAYMRGLKGVKEVSEPVIQVLEREFSRGATLRTVASVLNTYGHRTHEGKEFTAVQVMRLRDRIKVKQGV